MARGERPFLFCRYQIVFGDDALEPTSHFTVLQEMQGQRVVHGRSVSNGDGFANTLLMRPREHKVSGYQVLTWSAGYETDDTMRAHYNSRKDDIEHVSIGVGVRYADFVAVPRLRVLAVDDRVSDTLIGGKAGINRLRSVLRSRDDGDIQVIFEATPAEVRKALEKWSLTQFRFTIRPNNPRPVGRLGATLSKLMAEDGIGRLSASAKPFNAGEMRMSDDGLIRAATELVDAGYGQSSISGYTEDGLQAQIKRPIYSEDRAKNEKAQENPRELRVFVDTADRTEEEILMTAAASLIKFYK